MSACTYQVGVLSSNCSFGLLMIIIMHACIHPWIIFFLLKKTSNGIKCNKKHAKSMQKAFHVKVKIIANFVQFCQHKSLKNVNLLFELFDVLCIYFWCCIFLGFDVLFAFSSIVFNF